MSNRLRTRSRSLLLLFAAALVPGITGCQCCWLTEPYQDHIDHTSDYLRVYWDHLYCVRLDLTRIGRDDWCCAWGCCDDCHCCEVKPPHYIPPQVYTGEWLTPKGDATDDPDVLDDSQLEEPVAPIGGEPERVPPLDKDDRPEYSPPELRQLVPPEPMP